MPDGRRLGRRMGRPEEGGAPDHADTGRPVVRGDHPAKDLAGTRRFYEDLLGAQVWLSGPPTALPPAGIPGAARVARDRAEALDGADVVMALRVQRERQASGLMPPAAAYRAPTSGPNG